jgi:hypothetical protein
VPELNPAITTATGTLNKTYRKGGPVPSKSKKQARFMRAVAHGWKPDRVDAPPVSVAKEFVEADKGRDFRGMKNGRKDNGPGDVEVDKEVNAFTSSVKKRNAKIHNRRKQ